MTWVYVTGGIETGQQPHLPVVPHQHHRDPQEPRCVFMKSVIHASLVPGWDFHSKEEGSGLRILKEIRK